MEDSKEQYYSLNDLAHYGRSFMRYLLRKWWLIAAAVLVGGVLGFLYHGTQKPKYQAESTFILEEKTSGGGGLAGLASQFGFDLGSMGSGGSIFAGDNILSILTSKNVVYKVLLSPASDSAIGGATLADLYLEFSGAKKGWKLPALQNLNFHNTEKGLSPLQDSVLHLIYETLQKNNISAERVSKQGTIISVQVTAPHRDFARLMTERLITEASKLYLDIRVGTAQDNILQLQRRSDSLLYLLNSKSYRAAASQPLDVNPGIRTATVPVEIATRDKAVLGTLYAEVTKNLEASKLLLSQQTPVIQMLDQPEYLLRDNKRSLLFMLAFFMLAASFISVLLIATLFVYSNMKRKPVRQ